MSAISKSVNVRRRQGRRWFFASAVLDERNWTLALDGDRVRIGTKPLSLLHELLLHAGDVVTKDELLDAVWPGISVVEASLPTAVLKLRRALRDENGERRIIETVPGIGYRLTAEVRVETSPVAPSWEIARTPKPGSLPLPIAGRRWTRLGIIGGLALAVVAGSVGAGRLSADQPDRNPPAVSQREAANALRQMDVSRIEAMLAAGWNPNSPFNDEGDGALNMLLNVCEWDPGHDRRQLLLAARTLLEGGARLETRNGFGDTAYSIARAPRYCGPDHPVTVMLQTLCYAGAHPPGDRCLPDYTHPERNLPALRSGARSS